MKRRILAFWVEATSQGQVKAVTLREGVFRQKSGVYSYLPTPSSIKRIREVTKTCCVGAFATYSCEPYWGDNTLVAWVLYRLPNAVYPPPNGDKKRWPETPVRPQ